MSATISWKTIKPYAVSILIPVALGALVGWIISGSMDYDMVQKPALAPPAILFPIVWSILYVLMGVSYGILKERRLHDAGTMSVYYVQLAVNLLWPIFFFVLKWRLFSFFWIVALAILVILMVVRFYRKNPAAGLLQIPYAAWTLFASYLNLAVFLLNE